MIGYGQDWPEPPDEGAYGGPEQGSTAARQDHAVVRERFPATDLAALLGADRPERRWTVEDFLAEGASHSLIAAAGAGKSLLVLHCALCVAQGIPFLGRETQRRRVVYVDLENNETDLAERLDALAVTEDDAARIMRDGRFVHLCLPPLDPLDTAAGAAILAAILDAYEMARGDLVILDSTQRMVSGDENSADTWRAFYRHTATMLKRLGITVLRLDNHGKDADKGARGSSSKKDDVDAEWTFRRGNALTDETGNYFTLKPTKGRMLSALSPIDGQYVTRAGMVAFRGLRSVHDADLAAAVRLLDRLGLPADVGQIAAWNAVKDRDDRPTRELVRKAVRKRQTAMPNAAAYPLDPSYADASTHDDACPDQPPADVLVRASHGYADAERHTAAYPDPSAMPHAPLSRRGHSGSDQSPEQLLADGLGATPIGEAGAA